jgi:hypothetical protein
MERKVLGEVFGQPKKLKASDLKVVLVIDVISKSASKLINVTFLLRNKKIRNSEILSICYRLFRTIKEIIEPYKDEVILEGFLDIENELTSELYKKEERHIRKDTLYQLIKVLKDIVSQLKEKHNIEDSLFVF